MGSYAKQRAKDRIAELAGQGHDLVTFWHEATEAIAPAVPFYLTPCFYTMDPASLLATSHYHDGLPEIPREWLALEYYDEDFNKMADVARSERGVATLHEATGGDLTRSAKYRVSMQPFGADQEVLASLRTQSGEAWGVLALYREPGQDHFDVEELELLRELSTNLAEGARRGLLIGEAADPESPDAPGLVVLKDDWEVESMTPGVERWLTELPDGEWETAGKLPPRCSPSPVARCGPPRAQTHQARSPSRACSHARANGSSCTEPRWCPTAGAGSPSSLNPPTQRASSRC
ncbi:MAG: hypothetical protein M3Z95_05640 [Actinomycetota bacterium]|nr:hypothetical protein [Actinomycetota bacterium]